MRYKRVTLECDKKNAYLRGDWTEYDRLRLLLRDLPKDPERVARGKLSNPKGKDPGRKRSLREMSDDAFEVFIKRHNKELIAAGVTDKEIEAWEAKRRKVREEKLGRPSTTTKAAARAYAKAHFDRVPISEKLRSQWFTKRAAERKAERAAKRAAHAAEKAASNLRRSP